MILVSVKTKDEIRYENVLVWMFNNHYINIVEKWSESALKSIGSLPNPNQDRSTILDVIEYYRNHPSIMQIK